MDLGVRMRIIIYLQPWSESMALALQFHVFLLISPKPMFLSSSKIRREIVECGKNLFWELVPCVEMTLVSKFHLIWCPIAQESSLGRNERILGENRISRDLPPDNVWSQRTMSGLTRRMSDLTWTIFNLQFEFPETSQWTKSSLNRQCPSDSFSPTFVHYFGHILPTECPFDPILLPLAS
jgi:hypothetical protein